MGEGGIQLLRYHLMTKILLLFDTFQSIKRLKHYTNSSSHRY